MTKAQRRKKKLRHQRRKAQREQARHGYVRCMYCGDTRNDHINSRCLFDSNSKFQAGPVTWTNWGTVTGRLSSTKPNLSNPPHSWIVLRYS
jgi:hypothetical protein